MAFFFNVGSPENRKNGIRIDVISGAFNFLFLFSRYIIVVTVLNMTCKGQPRPQGLLVFSVYLSPPCWNKTRQLRPFSKKKPCVGPESEQFDTFKLVPRDPG